MTDEGMNNASSTMQATLDALMQEKASVGLCKGNDGEKMSFDQCTQYKQYAYPKYHAQMNEMLHEKTNTSSMPSGAEPQKKYSMGGGELSGVWPFADKAAAGGRARVAAAGVVVAVPLAVAALLTLRRGRWAASEHSLLSDSGSDSELPAE